MGGPERNVSIIIRAKNEADKALSSLLSSLGTLPGIAGVAGAALAGVGIAASKLAEAASKQEQADVRIAIALASIGQNSAAARARLEEFTSAMQDMSGVNDEAIAGVEALFIQLGHLSGDALERATKAALDYAAVTGQDVNAAATGMINVLIKGSGRLQGIATDFDASASKGERFESVLGQIESKTRGAAEVLGQTYAAALKRIANDQDDLFQALGKTIVENEAFRGLMASISVVLKEATGFVKEHSGALSDLVTAASIGGIALLQMAVKATAFETRLVSMGLTLGQVLVSLISMADRAPALAKKAFGWTDQDSIDLAKWAGEWMGRLAEIKGAMLDLGDVGEEAAAKIQAIIDSIGKTNWKPPAAAIKAIGDAGAGAIAPLTAFDELLKNLGITTMRELKRTTADVDEVLRQLVEQFNAGAISPEQWDAILEAVTQITQQLPSWTENMSAMHPVVQNVRDTFQEINDDVSGQLRDSTVQFGNSMVDAAFGAQLAWGQFFRQMMADLAKAIAKAFILRVIFKALGGGGAWSFGPGGSVAGQGIGIGGGVIAEASGLLGSPMQVSPTLPASVGGAAAAAFLGGGAGLSAGVAPAGGLTLNATILPRRDRTAEAIDMIDEIRVLVERRGYYLPATRVLG